MLRGKVRPSEICEKFLCHGGRKKRLRGQGSCLKNAFRTQQQQPSPAQPARQTSALYHRACPDNLKVHQNRKLVRRHFCRIELRGHSR